MRVAINLWGEKILGRLSDLEEKKKAEHLGFYGRPHGYRRTESFTMSMLTERSLSLGMNRFGTGWAWIRSSGSVLAVVGNDTDTEKRLFLDGRRHSISELVHSVFENCTYNPMSREISLDGNCVGKIVSYESKRPDMAPWECGV